MSLLLDALKKSEAQRRRGTSPTIDLTRTPSSGSRPRPGSRWLIVALVGVLLVAAAPWLWPPMSDWIKTRQDSAGEAGALTDATNSESSANAGTEAQAGVTEVQSVPPSVAGASSTRRVAVVDSTPAGEAGPYAKRPGNDSGKASGNGAGSPAAGPPKADRAASPETAAPASNSTSVPSNSNTDSSLQESRRRAQARPQQQRVQAPETDEPVARSQQVKEPAENFIRPWELPQAERAEFPELVLTVHFYTGRAADRFVLINGERYREGQRVGPGAKLVEVRQRGAVIEFGSYRVLIE